MDQKEDGERREHGEQLNRFLWLPPNPETLSSSSAWAHAPAALGCYFRARPTNASTTSFSLPTPLPTGRRPGGTGQRELQRVWTTQKSALSGISWKKTHHAEGASGFSSFQPRKDIVLSCPAHPSALLDTSQAPAGRV